MIVRDLTIIFHDNVSSPAQAFTLAINNFETRVSLDTITADGQGKLEYKGKTIPVDFKGTYALADGTINARLKAKDLDPNIFKDYLGPMPFTLQNGSLSQLQADATLRGSALDITFLGDLGGFAASMNALTIKDAAIHAAINLKASKDDLKNFTADGALDIANASVNYQDKLTAQALVEKAPVRFTYDRKSLAIDGNATFKNASGTFETTSASKVNGEIKIKLSIPMAQNPKNTKITFEGSGKVMAEALDGVPHVNKVTGLTAAFSFNNNGITFNNATIGFLNTVITGSGKYADKTLDADLQGELDPADLATFIPESLNLPAYKISGALEIHAHLTTAIPLPSTLPNLSGEAEFKDTWFQLTDNPMTFTANKARLKFDLNQENLEWHADAVVVNNDKSYSCDGTLSGFKAPEINAVLIGPGMKINAQFTKTGDKLDIASFKGQFKKTSASLAGTANLDEQTFDVKGKVLADLSEIPMKGVSLQGQCLMDVQCRGALKNYRQWNLKAAGSSNLVQGYGYKIKNIKFAYDQAGGIGIFDNIYFDAYGGQGLIKGRFDFTKNIISYAVRGVIDNLDLAALKLDTPIKNKKFSGTLGLKIAVQGLNNDIKNLKGGGSFTIKNGDIWEFSPLKELGTFLFAPRFGTMTFTTAKGDFFIKDNAVSTDNLELLGPEMSLLIDGNIGFNGTLDLLVNSQVPMPGPTKIIEETKIGESVAKAGSLTAIEVKGTIEKPKYKLLPIQANITKKITDAVSSILP